MTVLNIDLSGDAAQFCRLRVDGKLVAEFSLGEVRGHAELEREVLRARCLSRLPDLLRFLSRDLDRCGEEVEQAAFLRGLRDGFRRHRMPYPGAMNSDPPMPSILHEGSPSYARGYEHGEGIICYLEVVCIGG